MGRALLLVTGRSAGRKICARRLHEGATRLNSERVMAQHDLLTAGNAIADRTSMILMQPSPHAGTLKRDHPICFRAMGSPEDTSDGKCRMITGKTHKLLGRSHPWKPDGFRPIDLWHDGTSDAAYPEVGAGALACRNGTLRARKSMHTCRSSSNGRAHAFQAWNAGSRPVCGSTVIETAPSKYIVRPVKA